MPDYEDMILARQEELEMLLDDCDGECADCRYAREMPTQYFYEEPRYMCCFSETEEY